MKKYKNRYRIPSTRLQNWDYGSAALYYVTICTYGRVHYFGHIVDNQMQLSEIGEIVETEWSRTFDLRQDMNLSMGEFVVMPNHFHAIIGIGKNPYNTEQNREYKNEFGPQSKNLASIARGFKSSVTIAARKTDASFQWQERYHDSIIRDDSSFHRISSYIVNNPANWQDDEFHSAT